MDTANQIAALQPAAREILSTLGAIGERVRAELSGAPMSADSLANSNEEVRRKAMARLAARATQHTSELHRLKDEPAIARVVARNAKNHQITYYICRGEPPTGTGVQLASQRAPIGRLAALTPGDEIELERVGWLEVLESAHLRPQRDRLGWDSAPTVFRTGDWSAITADSLRDLVQEFAETSARDLMAELEREDAAPVLLAGVQREVIRHMALRDQPTLDRIQDEIFRLPLRSRLALFGPPGTGKTTTLIRRVGQKLDILYLAEDEQRLAERLATESGREHRHNWLMFTPTPLLKQYVKEAFGREDVATSDRLMKTWPEWRNDVARHQLGLLRTEETSGGFVLCPGESHLAGRPDWRAWYEDFDHWQQATWRTQMQTAIDRLAEAGGAAAAIGREAARALSGNQDLRSVALALAELGAPAIAEAAALETEAAATLRGWCNDQLNRDRAFATALADTLDRLIVESDGSEDEEGAEEDGEEARVTSPHRERDAMRAFSQLLRTLARARAAGRTLPRTSRSGRLLVWVADRLPQAEALTALGRTLQVQAALRQVAAPAHGVLRSTPRHYREFRRERQGQGRWYATKAPASHELDGDELDLLVALLLRRAQALLRSPSVRPQVDQPAWRALRPYLGLMRVQVLVDEATDFSPLQLAAMAGLVHPDSESFFACGDFNQRLTAHGTRDEGELTWAVPGITVQRVQVPYRQSRRLSELAHRILEVTGQALGEEREGAPAPVHDGYPPVLGEQLGDAQELADWLAARIREVEQRVSSGTSIAVLVPSEAHVESVARALGERLAPINLEVQACLQGRTVGDGHAVRVFDVQHIKGLEFEAVFLVGLDTLLAQHPDLFDKYLYVGATRAANCLGLACAGHLPESLEPLRQLFDADWTMQ